MGFLNKSFYEAFFETSLGYSRALFILFYFFLFVSGFSLLIIFFQRYYSRVIFVSFLKGFSEGCMKHIFLAPENCCSLLRGGIPQMILYGIEVFCSCF
jgi:hypothetical protein